MKTGMSGLSGDSLLETIRDHFKTITDHRDPSKIQIPYSDFFVSGFSIFSLKLPSLLQFDEQMREEKHQSRLAPLYGLTQVPCDTHLRSVLDEVNPEEVAPAFRKMFSKLQRSKKLEVFQFMDGKYLLPIDGTQYYSSNAINCESCMSKRTTIDGEDKILYYHQMLAGCIVHPDLDCVIPLCPEPMQKQDGVEKNDSERGALKRFLDRLRVDHPKLGLILVADALHTTGPLIRELKLYGISYILAVKPVSHETLFASVDKWEERGDVKYFTYEEEIGDKVKKKRIHQFRYANRILYNFADLNLSVNFLEYWETTQWVDPKGRLQEEKRHFSWVTDFEINKENIMQLMRGGRARWKIENETFNALKNQGYEFEHNFGHGYKNLSVIFAYLMFLAFLFDQLQQIGSKVFQKALRKLKRRKYLWDQLRAAFKAMYWISTTQDSWDGFLEFAIGPPISAPP